MRIRIRIGPSTGENVTHYKSWVAAIIYLTVIKSFSLLLIRPPRPQADEQEYHINHLPNDWYDFPYILIHFYSLLYIDLDTWL